MHSCSIPTLTLNLTLTLTSQEEITKLDDSLMKSEGNAKEAHEAYMRVMRDVEDSKRKEVTQYAMQYARHIIMQWHNNTHTIPQSYTPSQALTLTSHFPTHHLTTTPPHHHTTTSPHHHTTTPTLTPTITHTHTRSGAAPREAKGVSVWRGQQRNRQRHAGRQGPHSLSRKRGQSLVVCRLQSVAQSVTQSVIQSVIQSSTALRGILEPLRTV
jgi:hypothetical protein